MSFRLFVMLVTAGSLLANAATVADAHGFG